MEPPLDSRHAARRHDHKVAGLRRTLSSDPAGAASDAAPPTVRGRTHLESFARSERSLRGEDLLPFDVKVAKAGLKGDIEVLEEALVPEKNHREGFKRLCHHHSGLPGVIRSKQNKLEIDGMTYVVGVAKSAEGHGRPVAPVDSQRVGVLWSNERPLSPGVEQRKGLEVLLAMSKDKFDDGIPDLRLIRECR